MPFVKFFVPLPLTSQEKKVLGFILLLFVLGSLVLMARHFAQAPSRMGKAASTVQK